MQTRRPVNILLVDDQPAKLLSYESILGELGENLIKANSGREALECLLKSEIAVVLVDACMPELDGFELTTMIRNHPRFQRTAIILVSGLMTEDVDRLKGYVSGAVDYVSVPIIPEILRAKVSVFVDLFRKTEALEELNQALELRVEQRTSALMETTQKLLRAYEASHFLASIVESSEDAVIGQSLDGSVRTWNAGAERLFGYKAEAMLGHSTAGLIPLERFGEESGILEKLLSGQRVEHFETVRKRADGSTVEVSLTISLIRNEAGELIGTSQMARDITEQKRTAELMRQTQKLESLGVLAGGIAHDFNNLLVGILGNASMALDLLGPDSPVRSLLEGVLAAGENAAGLTRQMLAYGGRGHFVLSQIDLSAHVRETVPLIQAAVSRSVELRLELDEEVPPVTADASQVQQLVMNLVINAAESIPDNKRGRVIVKTRREILDERAAREQQHGVVAGEIGPGVYAVLEVQDNGCGMDDSTRTRMFEPFFTTKFAGRGLGLAAVLGIIRGHGGIIQVSSKPAEGTLFRILIPAAKAAVEEKVDILADLESLGGRGVVLVIDDEEIVRRVTQHALEQHGYKALVAEDGEQGLEVFLRNRDEIDCVILDATMPGLSGEETLGLLQSYRPDLPVVLSSGFAETEMLRRFDGKGLAGFLQKPYKAAALLTKVREVIASSASRIRGAVS